jgi:PAS domain-containing protein
MSLQNPRRGFLYVFAALITAFIGAHPCLAAADTQLPSDPNQFVREMVQHELDAEDKDHTHWRYRLHREDDNGAYDRDVIETKEGSISRTILINGKPLTQEQRTSDVERMKKLVDDPAERARREKRTKQDEDKYRELLKAIPDAFIFKYDGNDGELTRLSFTPNPHYSAPTRELTVYHSMTGHIWVDRAALRLAGIEGKLMEDVRFGWGLLGHLDKGGTFKVVQKNVGDNHWDAVSVDLNIQGRAIIFKTLNIKQKQVFTDYRRVPDDLTIAGAYEMLQSSNSSVAASNPPK